MRASPCSIHRQKAKNRAVKDSPYCEGMILLKSFFHLYFETWPLVSVFLLQKNQLVLQYFSAVTQLHSSFPKSSDDLNQKKWEAQRRQQKAAGLKEKTMPHSIYFPYRSVIKWSTVGLLKLQKWFIID